MIVLAKTAGALAFGAIIVMSYREGGPASLALSIPASFVFGVGLAALSDMVSK